MAAFTLSLAISIKAGAILMIPGLLGFTHYKYGLISLFKSILIILSF
jgi:hypothetical protein